MGTGRVARSFMICLLLIGVLVAARAAAAESPVSATAIAALLDGNGVRLRDGHLLDRLALRAVYAPRGYAPIWTAARRAEWSAALAAAAANGLDPADYAVSDRDPVERELLLTQAFLAYGAALAEGRVDPQDFESDWLMPVPRFDAAKTLARALAGSVATTLEALAPIDPRYRRLERALAVYRDAMHWRRLAIALPLKFGDSGADVRRLRARLAAEGYAAGQGDSFDAPLLAAVERFQAAHGLTDDGIVGRGTLAQLNVSPAARVRQIRLNLERWRSLPRQWPAERIEVNVPAASVTLFQPGQPSLTMRAVVGAPAHPTPVLQARLVSILLNPPWRVPVSIIEHEIWPAIKRDPDYLARNGFAYVDVPGGRELQQLPGRRNALGLIKFEMPNVDDIYLHDTPARWAFADTWRALSHGCVRLEDPRGLALRLLADEPEWTRATLDAAIATGLTQRIPLPHVLPVYLLYFTAFVDADGTVEFRNDLYGRDRRLAAALEAAPALEARAAAPFARTLSAAR